VKLCLVKDVYWLEYQVQEKNSKPCTSSEFPNCRHLPNEKVTSDTSYCGTELQHDPALVFFNWFGEAVP
jgi:hypothetical protein